MNAAPAFLGPVRMRGARLGQTGIRTLEVEVRDIQTDEPVADAELILTGLAEHMMSIPEEPLSPEEAFVAREVYAVTNPDGVATFQFYPDEIMDEMGSLLLSPPEGWTLADKNPKEVWLPTARHMDFAVTPVVTDDPFVDEKPPVGAPPAGEPPADQPVAEPPAQEIPWGWIAGGLAAATVITVIAVKA